MTTPAEQDPWLALRRFTQARIALGRAGVSLPTRAWLEFGLAHAQAKDAVRLPLDREKIVGELKEAGFEPLSVRSEALDRSSYLRRPDLGRRLDERSRELLYRESDERREKNLDRADVVFVIADGLSSCGVASHAVTLLQEVVLRLPGWRLAGTRKSRAPSGLDAVSVGVWYSRNPCSTILRRMLEITCERRMMLACILLRRRSRNR